MWIVRLALNRPYTFVVMAVLILLAGVASFVRTPKDIFRRSTSGDQRDLDLQRAECGGV